MLTASEIIRESLKLEAAGNYPNIRAYMANEWGVYWDNSPTLIKLAEALDAMMEPIERKHPNGYTYYEWLPR